MKFWMTGVIYPTAYDWWDWITPRFWWYRMSCILSLLFRGYSTWEMVIGVDHSVADRASRLVRGFADRVKKEMIGIPTATVEASAWDNPSGHPTEEDWDKARERWIVILEDIGKGLEAISEGGDYPMDYDLRDDNYEEYMNQIRANGKRIELDTLRTWKSFRTWAPAMWD